MLNVLRMESTLNLVDDTFSMQTRWTDAAGIVDEAMGNQEIPARVSGDVKRNFTSYDIHACLFDERRVDYLHNAIFHKVHPGDVVVDAGSGTGVLGMLAVQAGARKVYCVELNEEHIEVIEQNARRNGFSDSIVAIHGDSTEIDLPEPVDVIVSEVISCGFFYEPQLQIIANLKRFLKPGGSIIPGTMDNFVELIDAQEVLYNLRFNFDSRWKELDDRILTTRARYLSTNFLDDTPNRISTTTASRALVTGTANAIRLSYGVGFSEGVYAEQPTEFLLNPQIIFLAEPIPLVRGEYYDISLDYEASSTPSDCKIRIDRQERGTRSIDLAVAQQAPQRVDIISSNIPVVSQKPETTVGVADVSKRANALTAPASHTVFDILRFVPSPDRVLIDQRISRMGEMLQRRCAELEPLFDLCEASTSGVIRALEEGDMEELGNLGLDMRYTWLDDIVAAMVNGGPFISATTLAPYIAHGVIGSNPKNLDEHLSAEERIGLCLGAILRDFASLSHNVRIVAMLDDRTTVSSGQKASEHQLNHSIVELSEVLEKFDVIRPGDIAGKHYLLLRESEQIPAIATLIELLEQAGSGYLDRFGGDVTFFPNQELIDKLAMRSQTRFREIRRRGIAIMRDGKPTGHAIEAATFLDPNNREAVHLVFADRRFAAQQDKCYSLLRAAGVVSQGRYHGVCFDSQRLSPEVVSYAVCKLFQKSLQSYRRAIDSFDSWDRFDPDEYVHRNYGKRVLPQDQAIIEFFASRLAGALEPASLELVADVSNGPNMYPAMLLAPYLSQTGAIDLIEHAEVSQAFLRGLLADPEHGASPWNGFEDVMIDTGGSRYVGAHRVVCERASVVAGSVYSLATNRYQVLSSYFTAESVTTSRSQFWENIRSLAASVRPGGFLLGAHMTGSHGWFAGEETHFPSVNLSVEDIAEAYQDADLQIELLESTHAADSARNGYRSMVAVFARKA